MFSSRNAVHSMTWCGPLVNLFRGSCGPFLAIFWNLHFHAQCLFLQWLQVNNPLPCQPPKNTIALILGRAKEHLATQQSTIWETKDKWMCGVGVFSWSPLFSSIGPNFTPKPCFRTVLSHMAPRKTRQNAKEFIRDLLFVFCPRSALAWPRTSQENPIFITFSATWFQQTNVPAEKVSQKWDVQPFFIGSPCWCLSFLFKVPKHSYSRFQSW